MATVVGGSKDSGFQCDKNFTITRIYSGVSNDLRFLSRNYQDKGLVFFDLPFSIAADTIIIPYTCYTQVMYGNLCNNESLTRLNQEDTPGQNATR